MPAAGVDARDDANEPHRAVRGSLLPPARRALLVVGGALIGIAVLVAVVPIPRPSGPSDVGAAACGLPVVAMSRADPGEAAAALDRLSAGDPGPSEPTEEALAGLAELERDIEWYRACHRPAATRMVGANALVVVGATAAIAGSLARRRRNALAAIDDG